MNQKCAVAVLVALTPGLFAQAQQIPSLSPDHALCRPVAIDTNFTLMPEMFRFLRTEQQSFPPVIQAGAVIVPASTNTFGIFSFRYHRLEPMTFWGFGQPQNGQFEPKFTSYRINTHDQWRDLAIGYCGNGALSYTLQPDTNYELKIPLNFDRVATADQVRVSLNSINGMFWSEPFQLSAR